MHSIYPYASGLLHWPSVNEATLKDMGKLNLLNHNKTQQSFLDKNFAWYI